VNQGFLFGCSVGLLGPGPGLAWDKNGLVVNHAYSIMKAVEIEGKRLVLVRNPWGRKEWEGPWSEASKVLVLDIIS